MRNVKRRRARAPFWEPEPAIERTHGEKCTYFQGALCHTKGSIHSRVEWSETISRIRRGKGHRGKCSDSSRAASQIEVPIERPANHAHNASSWPPRVASPRPRAGHNHHPTIILSLGPDDIASKGSHRRPAARRMQREIWSLYAEGDDSEIAL